MTIASWQPTNPPLIIGHRGASAAAPENTLAACSLALEQEATAIELDVRLSADGQPVVIHDATVDRVAAPATGRVNSLTAAQLQQLTLDGGQTVPTLDDLFEAFGAQLLYNIELKSLGAGDVGLEAAVAERIAAHKLEDRVLVSSFDPLSLRRMRRHLPDDVPLAFIHATGAARLLCRALPIRAIHPQASLVNAAYMGWARERGYLVNVWTVDDPVEMVRLADLGVDGVITNRPDVARQTLDAWRGAAA